MNTALPHNKLQVHYRVLQQGETATVWVAGTTAGDTVPERRPAWLLMIRTQWVPALLEGEQLETALVQELRRSHPTAEDVAVDRAPCSGLGCCCRSGELGRYALDPWWQDSYQDTTKASVCWHPSSFSLQVFLLA